MLLTHGVVEVALQLLHVMPAPPTLNRVSPQLGPLGSLPPHPIFNWLEASAYSSSACSSCVRSSRTSLHSRSMACLACAASSCSDCCSDASTADAWHRSGPQQSVNIARRGLSWDRRRGLSTTSLVSPPVHSLYYQQENGLVQWGDLGRLRFERACWSDCSLHATATSCCRRVCAACAAFIAPPCAASSVVRCTRLGLSSASRSTCVQFSQANDVTDTSPDLCIGAGQKGGVRA
jgi:hypothetical protein